MKAYLAKMTGLSKAPLTRLIRQHRDTGRVEDRRKTELTLWQVRGEASSELRKARPARPLGLGKSSRIAHFSVAGSPWQRFGFAGGLEWIGRRVCSHFLDEFSDVHGHRTAGLHASAQLSIGGNHDTRGTHLPGQALNHRIGLFLRSERTPP